jgi:hypothetical protein
MTSFYWFVPTTCMEGYVLQECIFDSRTILDFFRKVSILGHPDPDVSSKLNIFYLLLCCQQPYLLSTHYVDVGNDQNQEYYFSYSFHWLEILKVPFQNRPCCERIPTLGTSAGMSHGAGLHAIDDHGDGVVLAP